MTHYYFTVDADKAFSKEYILNDSIKTDCPIDMNYLYDTAIKLNKAVVHLTASQFSKKFLTREVFMPNNKMYKKTY